MSSSGMLCRVALVKADVSEERSASIIRVTGIGQLGKMLAVSSNRRIRRNIAETAFFTIKYLFQNMCVAYG
jgi:hypothetical protein